MVSFISRYHPSLSWLQSYNIGIFSIIKLFSNLTWLVDHNVFRTLDDVCEILSINILYNDKILRSIVLSASFIHCLLIHIVIIVVTHTGCSFALSSFFTLLTSVGSSQLERRLSYVR